VAGYALRSGAGTFFSTHTEGDRQWNHVDVDHDERRVKQSTRGRREEQVPVANPVAAWKKSLETKKEVPKYSNLAYRVMTR
jgi:hypothetical protein